MILHRFADKPGQRGHRILVQGECRRITFPSRVELKVKVGSALMPSVMPGIDTRPVLNGSTAYVCVPLDRIWGVALPIA